LLCSRARIVAFCNYCIGSNIIFNDAATIAFAFISIVRLVTTSFLFVEAGRIVFGSCRTGVAITLSGRVVHTGNIVDIALGGK